MAVVHLTAPLLACFVALAVGIRLLSLARSDGAIGAGCVLVIAGSLGAVALFVHALAALLF